MIISGDPLSTIVIDTFFPFVKTKPLCAEIFYTSIVEWKVEDIQSYELAFIENIAIDCLGIMNKYIMDFNDEITREAIRIAVEEYLDKYFISEIYQYKPICDQTNNPPTVIDANDMQLNVYIQPTLSLGYFDIKCGFYKDQTRYYQPW